MSVKAGLPGSWSLPVPFGVCLPRGSWLFLRLYPGCICILETECQPRLDLHRCAHTCSLRQSPQRARLPCGHEDVLAWMELDSLALWHLRPLGPPGSLLPAPCHPLLLPEVCSFPRRIILSSLSLLFLLQKRASSGLTFPQEAAPRGFLKCERGVPEKSVPSC